MSGNSDAGRGEAMRVERTSIGRIVVPPKVPPGFALFYTTIDFDGRIDDRIMRFIGERLGSETTLATCSQIHGAKVRQAKREPRTANREPECDALWSDTKHTALGIKIADCLPVTIIDARNSIIANIHSGWRGTVQGITAATLDAVDVDASSSFAWLGPSIRVCCFEVGEEVAGQFDPRFIDRTRGPKPHVDIAGLTVALLRERGFKEESVVDTGLCTRCDAGVAEQPRNPTTSQPLFHSYRRDKRGGRNLAIVAQ